MLRTDLQGYDLARVRPNEYQIDAIACNATSGIWNLCAFQCQTRPQRSPTRTVTVRVAFDPEEVEEALASVVIDLDEACIRNEHENDAER